MIFVDEKKIYNCDRSLYELKLATTSSRYPVPLSSFNIFSLLYYKQIQLLNSTSPLLKLIFNFCFLFSLFSQSLCSHTLIKYSSFCHILMLLDLYLRCKGHAKPLQSSRYLWYLTLACQPSTVFLKHQEILSFDLIL